MEAERVDPPRAEHASPAPRRRFEELLRARTDRPLRRPAPVPRHRPPPTRSTGAPVGRAEMPARCRTAELRGQARVEMDSAARGRIADGARATAQATARLDGRAAELLRGALRSEQAARSEPWTASVPAALARHAEGASAPPERQASTTRVAETASAGRAGTDGAERVERALALVERIEHFVRSGRPSLALTLRGGLAGRLELQRVAPGAISIRIASARPPPDSELSALRQALQARGLSVRSLETRTLTASAADACSPCP
jgi:hypothetical protein